jgi:transposase
MELIEDGLDSELYVKILKDNIKTIAEEYEIPFDDLIFQHDNDPKHTSLRARTFLEEEQIKVLFWPANSPDLNPIEHMWAELKRALNGYNTKPTSMKELWERTHTEWYKISKETCQKYIKSMPARIQAVIKAKGGHTTY